jgi:hypothetical protein
LRDLFDEGVVRLSERPQCANEPAARALLANAYAAYRLEVAGSPLAFDEASAMAAAELVRHACWYLLSHAEPDAELERTLRMPAPPATAASHLSADLTLRYLPQIQRRARAIAAGDGLTQLLEAVLREWPLSGILADVAAAPAVSLEFEGHPGLQMLYSERFSRNPKPSWLPTGRTLEVLEWIAPGVARAPFAKPAS